MNSHMISIKEKAMSTTQRAIQGLAIGLCLLVSLIVPIHARAASPALDEQIVADAYVYLVGRALVVRQEHLDVAAQGGYNVAFHNPLGSATFVNPNLSVANTEAWIAVDDTTPVLLEIPKIEGRYYTAQILDEWGETLTNIHERNYPLQPYGKFAFVAPGSRVAIPDDAVRIELRSQKAKMLARVELQNDRDGAVALQRQIRITPLGTPKFTPALEIPAFEKPALIGVELFDRAEDLLKSAPDVSPIAAQLQAQVRAVARRGEGPDATGGDRQDSPGPGHPAVQPVCHPGGWPRPQQLARHHGRRQLRRGLLDSQLGEPDRNLGEQHPRSHLLRHDA